MSLKMLASGEEVEQDFKLGIYILLVSSSNSKSLMLTEYLNMFNLSSLGLIDLFIKFCFLDL